MDSLTHIVLGAAVGEVVLGKKAGNKAVIVGAIAGSSPDFDVFFTGLFNPVNALFVHRGFSHSLLLLLIAAPLLAWIFFRFNKNTEINYLDWLKLFLYSILSHIFIDCFNTYGTGILEPFSRMRVAYDSIGIIDLMLTIPMLILATIILFYKRSNQIRRILATSSLIFASLYLGFTIFNKIRVEKIVVNQLADQNVGYVSFRTSPSPLTNFLWMVAVEQQDGFMTGYYSIFDKSKEIDLKYTPKNLGYIDSIKENKQIQGLIRFTKGYYIVEKEADNSLWMYDLRFGTLGFNEPKPWVFSFGIAEKDGDVNITRSHPDRKISYKTFNGYWKRVFKGKYEVRIRNKSLS